MRVFNRFLNMVSHNPNGREGPSGGRDAGTREEGFLYWLAWTSHNGLNLQNIDDANGPMRPLFLTGTCATLTSLVANEPELEFLMGLSPVLATACGNGAKSPLDGLPKLPNLPNTPIPTPTVTPSLPVAGIASKGGEK